MTARTSAHPAASVPDDGPRLARHPHRWPSFLTITPAPRPALTGDFAERPGAWVRALLRGSWLPLTIAAVLSSLSYLAAGLISPVIGAVVDHGLDHGLSTDLLPGLLALAGLGIGGGLIGGLTEMFSMGAWATGWQPSARGAAHRLGDRPRAVTRQIASGDVVSTVTADSDSIGALMYFVANVVGALVSTVVVGVLMLRMDVGLGLLVLLGLPVVLLLVGVLLKPLNKRMSVQREEQGRLTTVTTDVVAGLRVLRGIGGEDVYSARYAEQSAKVRDAGIKVASTQALLAAIRAGAPMILTAAVVGATAQAAFSGRITVGDFVTFYGYTAYLSWPLMVFSNSVQDYTRATVGVRRLRRLLTVTPKSGTPDERRVLNPLHGERLEGELVDEASGLRVAPGRLTALVAADPDVSAALATRLGRFDDAGPVVTLANRPLTGMPLEDVRASVVVSGATAQLFTGTLREALDPLRAPAPTPVGVHALVEAEEERSGVAAVDQNVREAAEHLPGDNRLLAAIEVADAHDVLSSLDLGLAGMITEKGRSLSGGQRQRVSLARALLTEAPTLVLVEPTSALDSHTESRVAHRVRDARRGRTTVLVTESPLVLEVADEVVLLDAEGRERVRSTHRDLLDRARAGEPDALAYRAVVARALGEAAPEAQPGAGTAHNDSDATPEAQPGAGTAHSTSEEAPPVPTGAGTAQNDSDPAPTGAAADVVDDGTEEVAR